jgi:hypothetical protein
MPEPEKVERKKSASEIRGAPAGQRFLGGQAPAKVSRDSRDKKDEKKDSDKPASSASDKPSGSSARKLPERARLDRTRESSSVVGPPPGTAAPKTRTTSSAVYTEDPIADADSSRPKRPKKERGAAPEEDSSGFVLTSCPSCGGGVPQPPPRFCNSCSMKLPTVRAKKKKKSAAPEEQGPKICSGCGNLVRGLKVCGSCGTKQVYDDE